METLRDLICASGLELTYGLAKFDDSYIPYIYERLRMTPAESVRMSVHLGAAFRGLEKQLRPDTLIDPKRLDPEPILRSLVSHGIEFVLIGGIAASARLAPWASYNLEITPSGSKANIERVASALKELDATPPTGEPSGVPFPIDARGLANSQIWTMTTPYGDIDCSFVPSGTQGYDDLKRGAGPVEVFPGLVVQVASLSDVIRSKEAAGRPKDLAVLPLLRQTLEEIHRREGRT
ncbi:MAG: hypothetical protein WEB00_09925 [Dehalococcoidia bacterium]